MGCTSTKPRYQYLQLLVTLHGQAQELEELFPVEYKKPFRRDLYKLIFNYGKVDFRYEELYLVGLYRYITPLSILLLMELHRIGACIPFYTDKRGIVICNYFPSSQKRSIKRINFLLACNKEVWQQINTCRHADKINFKFDFNNDSSIAVVPEKYDVSQEVKPIGQPKPIEEVKPIEETKSIEQTNQENSRPNNIEQNNL